jgi:sugar transferase EpsL
MYPVIKRSLDILTAGLGLLILSPLLIVIFLLILIQMGRPIIFKQMRPGLNGKPFYMYKFRTMTNEKDEQGNPLSDEQRLTRLGRFLRSTSLDELPELFNVLKGDMSLVGPRPLLMQYLARYTPEQARRHEAQPGITGWAQVNGRNAITWEEKFALDVWYVDNRSFWLDIKILAMTVVKVFKREGISAKGEATMPEFMGILKEPDIQYLKGNLIIQEAAAALDKEN